MDTIDKADAWDAACEVPPKAAARLDRYETALHQISQWADAYPLEVFPKPDLEKAHRVLQANGLSLGAIAADNMRHVVEGVGKIAKGALGNEEANDV